MAINLQRAILRNVKPDVTLLDAGRASWTNIGVVAALGLTIAAAMLQADPMSDPMSAKGQAYAYCSWMSYGVFLMACVQASMAVMYTDILSEDEMRSLLESRQNILTRPLLAFILAFAHAGLGLALFLWDVYGDIAAIFIFALFPTTYMGIYSWWQDLDTFARGET